MPDLLHAVVGIVGLVGLAWLLSENRRAVPWRAIAAGLALQILLGIIFLRFSPAKSAFLKINDALLVLERATQAVIDFQERSFRRGKPEKDNPQ